jgi:hypothetical protein
MMALKKVYATALEAKVTGVNFLNHQLYEAHDSIVKVLRPWVGKTVVCADGKTLLERLKSKLPYEAEFPGVQQVYYKASSYALSVHFRVTRYYVLPSHKDENGIQYHDGQLRVGNLSDGKLDSIAIREVFATDYSVTQVATKRKELVEARIELGKLEHWLKPFGEYDV